MITSLRDTLRARSGLGAGLLLFLMLGVAAAALGAGLGGAFVIDDFANLEDLQKISAEPTLDSALRFIFNGVSSPLGRPLALATFALQYQSWPNHPGDFIYVNIALHLLNGCLLFWGLLRTLELARLPGAPRPEWLALAATWMWLLAAPQAGAVLYVIQRMAVLSGTFTLLGLLVYLDGRRRDAAAPGWHATLQMMAGAGIAVVPGVLAKETAALFPLMVLCLEYTLLQDLPRSRHWRAFSLVCLWLPSAVVVADLLTYIPTFVPGVFPRNFTLGERLLTETRVLFMYLQKFLFPPLYGIRLYYDDVEVSHSLLSPWTTLASVSAWAALIVAAFRLRRRAPPFSFAVLWYLASHLLEATVIPLELAFDHRNYVALLGPALALAWYGHRLLAAPALQRVRPLLIAGGAAYAAFVGIACWQAAAFWGRPWELAHFWADQHPASRRAQITASKFYWRMGQPQEAIASHERSLLRWPGDVSFFLSEIETTCAFPDLARPDLGRMPSIVKEFDSTIPATVGLLDTLVTFAESGACTRYSPAELWSVVQMSFETPKLASQEQNRLLLLSRIADLAHDRVLARALLDQAILTPPAPVPPILQRGVLLSIATGDMACARSYLARYRAGGAGSAVRTWSYENNMQGLEDLIQARAPLFPPRPPDEPSCRETGAPAS